MSDEERAMSRHVDGLALHPGLYRAQLSCKIGRDVAGRPVIHRDCVPDPGQCFVLSYVSGHGAPEDVRAYFLSRGYTPGKDFMLAA